MGTQVKKIQTGKGPQQPATMPSHVPPPKMPKTGT